MPRTPMRIIDMQRRIHEVGRLRTGVQTTKRGKKAPERIDHFRFTSTNERAIAKVAELFGGQPHEWKDAPTQAKQWEVFSTAPELEVIVPPYDMAISQAFEAWSGGGCQRRCDGEREYLSEQPCLCAPEIEAGQERMCKPTTRVNVMIPALGTFGVWRLESHSYNAAAELVGAAELCQMAAASGDLHPARLWIEGRSGKRKGANGRSQTVHYNVPVLDPDLPLSTMLPSTPTAREITGAREEAPAPARSGVTPVDTAALPPGPVAPLADQLRAPEGVAPAPRSNAAQEIPPTGRRPRPAGGAEPASDAEAPSEPPPDEEEKPTPPAEDEGVRLDRARNVSIACADAGFAKDEARHAFLLAFSGGRYESAKDVPAEDVAAIRAVLVRIKKGDVAVVDGKIVEKPTGGNGEQGSLMDTAPPEGEWNRARWLATVADVPGAGQVSLLKWARAKGASLGIGEPSSLDELTHPDLVKACLDWLAEKREKA